MLKREWTDLRPTVPQDRVIQEKAALIGGQHSLVDDRPAGGGNIEHAALVDATFAALLTRLRITQSFRSKAMSSEIFRAGM